MLDKEAAKELKVEFWSAFTQHMKRHRNAKGKKQKWANYRTGIKNIYFRLEIDKEYARVCIDMQNKNKGIRELFYLQWEEFQMLLHSNTGTKWVWCSDYLFFETGKEISRIYVENLMYSIYRKKDWQPMFEWLEPILRGLDEVWTDAYDIFKDMNN